MLTSSFFRRIDCKTRNPRDVAMKTALDALRDLATHAALPFGRLHHVWRDLQADQQVPKSAGKAVCPPRRQDFAKVIAAVGLSAQESLTPSEAVDLARTMTLDGRKMTAADRPGAGQTPPALRALAEALDATSLDPMITSIQFDAGAKTIRIIRTTDELTFKTPVEPHRERGWTAGDDRLLDMQTRKTFTPIRTVVIFDGNLITDFAAGIEWDDTAIPHKQAAAS